MALSENLAVYKTTYDLLLRTYREIPNVSRDLKYTVVEKIKEEILDLLALVNEANLLPNRAADRSPLLEQARRLVLRLKVRYRLLHDLKAIDDRHYAGLAVLIESVSKQLTGWQKSLQ